MAEYNEREFVVKRYEGANAERGVRVVE
jgi:hypothetical protein